MEIDIDEEQLCDDSSDNSEEDDKEDEDTEGKHYSRGTF